MAARLKQMFLIVLKLYLVSIKTTLISSPREGILQLSYKFPSQANRHHQYIYYGHIYKLVIIDLHYPEFHVYVGKFRQHILAIVGDFSLPLICIKNSFQFLILTRILYRKHSTKDIFLFIKKKRQNSYPISSFMKVEVGQCWHMNKSFFPQSTVAICDKQLRLKPL